MAFDFQRACFNVEDAKPQDEASLFFWDWLLKQVKLSPQHAALHKVYQEDAVAIYYDLDGDGDDEIIGTHLSSAVNGDGETLLYILKNDKNGDYREITGEEIYFDYHCPVCILMKKTDGYRNIQIFKSADSSTVVYAFNKAKGQYYKKTNK